MKDLQDKELQTASRIKLNDFIKANVLKVCEIALDLAEVSYTNRAQYDVFKSKVLRAGNDCIRNTQKELMNYKIQFVETGQDLFIFNLRRSDVKTVSPVNGSEKPKEKATKKEKES